MKRPPKICNKCRRVKDVSCTCEPPKPFEGIRKDNYSFYNSRGWRKVAKAHKQSNPLCTVCLQEGRTTAVEVTDHIKSIDDGGSKLDVNNLQSLCHPCHNSKTGRNKRNFSK